jgi:hypothetical protein
MIAEMYPMSEPRDDTGGSTVTVRMDSDLVRIMRVYCAGKAIKLVDYLDELVRARAIADYEAFMASDPPATKPSRQGKKKRGKSTESE